MHLFQDIIGEVICLRPFNKKLKMIRHGPNIRMISLLISPPQKNTC